MLTIDKLNNLRFTYGDSFRLTATLMGQTLADGDVVTLAIKGTAEDATPKMTMNAVCTQVNNDILAIFEQTAEEMEALNVGSYVYDISLTNLNGRITYMFTANLKVEAVAHNV